MSDLFPQKGKPKKPPAPTKALLTLWDSHLTEQQLPKLTDEECKRMGRILRTCWHMCRQDTAQVEAAIHAYFHSPDGWTLEHGFPVLGFMERFRGLVLKARREEQRREADRIRRQQEALWSKRLNTDDDPTVAIEKVKETVAKFRAMPKPGGKWEKKA